MVDAEYRLATEVLHLKHLHAVMGISMGGMQTFEWMVKYPAFMDRRGPDRRLAAADQLRPAAVAGGGGSSAGRSRCIKAATTRRRPSCRWWSSFTP